MGSAEKRDGLPDGEYLVFAIWSSRRPLWADTQPFFLALSQNSNLYVKEMSKIFIGKIEFFSLI
jgi:hypothetical protein